MGKIADALEKRRDERELKVERLSLGPEMPERVETSEPPTKHEVKSIALHEINPKLVTLSAPDSLDAESFKVLRTQILFPKNGQRPRTIMVTSALPGEGKTFVSANLGASIAMGVHEHVLLVDCDFRRPNLHRMFGYAQSLGLHEYLIGVKRLAELLIRTQVEKLSLLPAGSPPENPSELLSSKMMQAFLAEVKERYSDRFIIIDSPPSNVTADTSALANYVDGILFVVMARRAPREMVHKSLETLGKKKVIGMFFNGFQESHKEYRKYYKKYYN
jgi:protein-tyrosine kinase